MIAGKCSLAEAIERFRELDRQWPDARAGTKNLKDPGMSQDESDGWAVIHQVRQVPTDRPEEAAAVAGRLEKELQRLLADQKKQDPMLADPRIKPAR